MNIFYNTRPVRFFSHDSIAMFKYVEVNRQFFFSLPILTRAWCNYCADFPISHSSPDLLVNDDTDGSLGHVEHTPRLPVIEFVRHAFLKCTIALDRETSHNE